MVSRTDAKLAELKAMEESKLRHHIQLVLSNLSFKINLKLYKNCVAGVLITPGLCYLLLHLMSF